MRTIDLSSRDAYLTWVREWKGYLKAIESEIRYWKRKKHRARNTARQYRTWMTKYPTNADLYTQGIQWNTNEMNLAIAQLRRLKYIANTLHFVRTEGKRQSKELKQAQLQEA